MAAPAGSLVVKIGADTSGLRRGAKQTESTLTKMGRHAGKLAGGLAALGAAAVAAGAAMAVGLVKSGLTAIDTQAKLAQSVDGTIGQLRALTNAAGDAGVSAQEMSGNLQRMNRRLGEVVSTGAGPAAKWIERLGINSQALLELPLDERVAVIADEISKLGTQAEMASAAFAIFGDAGLKMVPLLQQGGDAIRAEADEVERLGLNLSAVDAAKVEQAVAAMGVFGDLMDATRDRITVAVAPLLNELAERFRSMALEAGGFGDAFGKAFSFIGGYLGVAVDIGGIMLETFRRLYDVAVGVFDAIGKGLAWLAEDFRKAVNQIIRGINSVATYLPFIEEGIQEIEPGWIGRRFEDTMDIAETAVAFSMDAIREYLGGDLPSENFERWLQEVQEKSQQAAEAAVAARSSMAGLGGVPGDGGEGDDKEQEAFQRRLESLRGRYLTEEELLREHNQVMADLTRAWREGEFETEAEWRNVKEQAEADHMERLKQIRERGLTDLERFTNQSYAKQAQIVSGRLADMTASVANENKKMFAINKIAGIANAILSAHEGISKTLAAYPWPLSAAMAALQGAAAFAQVNAIKSAKFGGGGGSAPSLAGGTPAPPVTPVSGGTPGQQDFVQDVSVTLVGGNSIGADQLEQLGEVLADNGGRIGAFRVLRAA